MIPKRVIFLCDKQEAPEIDRDLLAQFRDEIEHEILRSGSDDAETIPLGAGLGVALLTNLPKPKIGRVMARWILLSDEEALVTGLRTGEAFEAPPADFDD